MVSRAQLYVFFEFFFFEGILEKNWSTEVLSSEFKVYYTSLNC